MFDGGAALSAVGWAIVVLAAGAFATFMYGCGKRGLGYQDLIGQHHYREHSTAEIITRLWQGLGSILIFAGIILVLGSSDDCTIFGEDCSPSQLETRTRIVVFTIIYLSVPFVFGVIDAYKESKKREKK